MTICLDQDKVFTCNNSERLITREIKDCSGIYNAKYYQGGGGVQNAQNKGNLRIGEE